MKVKKNPVERRKHATAIKEQKLSSVSQITKHYKNYPYFLCILKHAVCFAKVCQSLNR